MKKTFFALMAFLILLSSSCRRNTNNGGSWTFKGRTYDALICQSGNMPNQASWGLTADTYTQSDNILNVPCPMAFSIQSGIYTVVATNTLSASQVVIGLQLGCSRNTDIGGISYHSTGGNGSNQTAQVTLSTTNNIEKVSISGSGIIMRNDTVPYDSAILDFNIISTN